MSKLAHSNAICSKNHLSWFVALNANPLEEELSHIPQMKWKFPPKLVLDHGWHVASGEGSCEVDFQKEREAEVIEAVYSHCSDIPSNPLFSSEMESAHDDESPIPLIPIVPIEEAVALERAVVLERAGDASASIHTFKCHSTSESLTISQFNPSVCPNLPIFEESLLNILSGLEGGDLAVAAGAAATAAAVIASKDKIDTELLIKILTDPKLMKKLINETGIGANTEPRLPSGRKPVSYPLLSNSIPDSAINVLMAEATKQSIKLNTAPRSNSHSSLIQHCSSEARESVFASSGTHNITSTNEPRPLIPPTLNSDEKQFVGLINQYGVPNAPWTPPYSSFTKAKTEAIKPMVKESPPEISAWIKPDSSCPPPFSPTSRQHCVASGYRVLDCAASEPHVGSNHPTPFTLTNFFHSSLFPSGDLLPSPAEDINYLKSLIKQHGPKHIKDEDKFSKHGQPLNHLHELAKNSKSTRSFHMVQKPCMFFNSFEGCRKGSSCLYMHAMAKRWPTSGVEEVSVAKKVKLRNRGFDDL